MLYDDCSGADYSVDSRDGTHLASCNDQTGYVEPDEKAEYDGYYKS